MFLEELEKRFERGFLPQEAYRTLKQFHSSYEEAVGQKKMDEMDPLFCLFLDTVIHEIASATSFEAFHRAERKPIDFYQMGLDLFRPLIIFEKSTVRGLEYLHTIEAQLAKQENVIFFANHQAELDPQVISLLLEKDHAKLAEAMIFVAGDRVTTDPLAVPFSRGRNLLCIYSKRHIDHPPARKEEKLKHNQQTMLKMGELLRQGGRCIYVAPSGGRDRPDENGNLTVAPFDSQSIELFRLIATQAKRPTHYYPLSLVSYSLLPPPTSVEKGLGEERHTTKTPIHLAVGAEVNMDQYPGSESLNKKERRQARAEYLWRLVKNGYEQLLKNS